MYHHRCTTFISNRIGTLTAVAKPTLYCFARMEGIYDKRHNKLYLHGQVFQPIPPLPMSRYTNKGVLPKLRTIRASVPAFRTLLWPA